MFNLALGSIHWAFPSTENHCVDMLLSYIGFPSYHHMTMAISSYEIVIWSCDNLFTCWYNFRHQNTIYRSRPTCRWVRTFQWWWWDYWWGSNQFQVVRVCLCLVCKCMFFLGKINGGEADAGWAAPSPSSPSSQQFSWNGELIYLTPRSCSDFWERRRP